MLAKGDFKCCKNSLNQALFACIESSCAKFGLMCGDGNCECRTDHRHHRIFQLEDIVRSLDQTPTLEKDTEEKFQRIERLISDLTNELAELRWKHSEHVRKQAGKRPAMDEFVRMCQDKEHATGQFFGEMVKNLYDSSKQANLYELEEDEVSRQIDGVKWEMSLLKYRMERLWSPRYSFGGCAATVAVKKGSLQAIKTTDDVSPNNALAIVEPRLAMTSPSKISFRVDSLTDWVSFGVCLRTPFASKNYKHDCNNVANVVSKIQHGSYMMSTHSYMFSHSKREDNQVKRGSIKAKAGDIVTLEYNPTSKTLSVRTMNDEFELLTDIAPNTEDAVHFCVGFCYAKGQAVSIE